MCVGMYLDYFLASLQDGTHIRSTRYTQSCVIRPSSSLHAILDQTDALIPSHIFFSPFPTPLFSSVQHAFQLPFFSDSSDSCIMHTTYRRMEKAPTVLAHAGFPHLARASLLMSAVVGGDQRKRARISVDNPLERHRGVKVLATDRWGCRTREQSWFVRSAWILSGGDTCVALVN